MPLPVAATPLKLIIEVAVEVPFDASPAAGVGVVAALLVAGFGTSLEVGGLPDPPPQPAAVTAIVNTTARFFVEIGISSI
jgi:hypothetical protein